MKFEQNLGDDETFLLFTEAELAGCPADLLSARKQEDGRFKFTLGNPCVEPLLQYCSVPATREKMETAYHSQCKEVNTRILEETNDRLIADTGCTDSVASTKSIRDSENLPSCFF